MSENPLGMPLIPCRFSNKYEALIRVFTKIANLSDEVLKVLP